jgi:DNA-binding transcriptional MerR regulator
VLREAKKAFKPEDYQEIKMHALKRLTELGFALKELEELLG